MQHIHIQHRFDLGKLLAHQRLERVFRGHVQRIEADGVDSMMAGQENGPLVVEVLGNDGDVSCRKICFTRTTESSVRSPA